MIGNCSHAAPNCAADSMSSHHKHCIKNTVSTIICSMLITVGLLKTLKCSNFYFEVVLNHESVAYIHVTKFSTEEE